MFFGIKKTKSLSAEVQLDCGPFRTGEAKADKLVIAIDASRSIDTIQKTGVEKVSDELIATINQQLTANNNVEVVFYTPKLISWLPQEKQKVLKWPPKFLWTQIRLAWEVLFHPPNVMFFPVHTIPLLLITSYWLLVTKFYKIIHDIAFKKSPSLYSFKQRVILNLDLYLAKKLCRKIFVPTQAVKNDLIKYAGAHPNKIVVVHWGYKPICHSERREESLARLAESLAKRANASSIFNEIDNWRDASLPLSMTKRKKQILYLGRVEEKKNISNLIKAFDIFSQKYPDCKLILAGKPGIGYDEIQRQIPAHQQPEPQAMAGGSALISEKSASIGLLGYVSEAKKQELLGESMCLMLVSKEEGFGFPILEAFDYGLPVVAADIPVLREIGGDACLYVNPDSPEEIAIGLSKIMSEGELRNELVRKGKERLKEFSWEKTARKIMEVMIPGE